MIATEMGRSPRSNCVLDQNIDGDGFRTSVVLGKPPRALSSG